MIIQLNFEKTVKIRQRNIETLALNLSKNSRDTTNEHDSLQRF